MKFKQISCLAGCRKIYSECEKPIQNYHDFISFDCVYSNYRKFTLSSIIWTFERFYPMGHVLINKVAAPPPPFSKIRKKLKMNKVIYLHSNKKTNPHSYVPLIFRSALAQSIIDTKV